MYVMRERVCCAVDQEESREDGGAVNSEWLGKAVRYKGLNLRATICFCRKKAMISYTHC